MTEKLIYDELDDRILAAAAGVRKKISDQDPLPGRIVKFAPSTAKYKVMKDGSGTVVMLYGTEEHDFSIAMNVKNFRPYLYVSLKPIDEYTADPERREELIASLLKELNQQMLLASALKKMKYDKVSAETSAFREASAGYIVKQKLSDGKVKLMIRDGRKHCAPIVAHRIVDGIPAKGFGANSGYRGMKTTRFLQIFFYCPSLVREARSLLQNIDADRGALMQAEKLNASFDKTPANETSVVTNKESAGGMTKMQRAAADEGQRKLGFVRQQIDPAGSDEDEEDDDDDEDLEQAVVDAENDMADARLEAEINATLDGSEDDEWSAAVDDGVIEPTVVEESDDSSSSSESDDDPDDGFEPGKLEYTVIENNVADTLKLLEERVHKRFIRRAIKASKDDPLHMLAPGHKYDVFEADIDFVLRFALDCGFSFEQWISVDCEQEIYTDTSGRALLTPSVLKRVRGRERLTRLQIELEGDYRLIKFDADDPIQNTMPNHVLISLDDEMAPGRRGEFPKAKTEPMLQSVFIIRGKAVKPDPNDKETKDKFEYRSVSFTLQSVECLSKPRKYCTRRDLLCFAEEAVMFKAIARFIRALDPDFVTGYNIDNFDLPYMLERAEHLGVGAEFARAWGRSLHGSAMTVRPTSFQSTQQGHVEYNEIRAEGLAVVDLLRKFQRDPLKKFRYLSLNAVSGAILKKQKEDVDYSQINDMQETAAGREHLRHYCEWDALLPLLMFETEQVMPSMIEMARINVCTVEMILHKGQQVRSKCCMYREGALEQPPYRFYTRPEEEKKAVANDSFQGAEVIDPKPGLYKEPVITLDQASLYPSIMVTHNTCITTRVAPDYDLTKDPDIMKCADPVNELTLEERQRRADAAVYTVNDVTEKMPYKEAPSENAPRFLKHGVLVGIVTKVQMKYLAHRKRTKNAMNDAYKAGDTAMGNLLNQRQLAIKMLANSLYGMFGATMGFAYSPVVSDTVTRRGRCLLFLMRAIATLEFAHYGTNVIYGDTDSIFVLLKNVATIEEAAKIGVEMAAHITKRMKEMFTTDAPTYNILSLEFEKVFRSLLLIAKKRYAGLKYEYSVKDGKLKPSPEEGEPITSGLESKRRDTTLLVADNITDVLALLLDYHYPMKENLERARAYVWQHMVRPLLDGTINRRMLIVTKQLRMLPEDYAAKLKPGASLPGHVVLASKLIERAGGPNAQNAPKAGARMGYVVVEGKIGEKVSERFEDPDYALAQNIPIDAGYYLDSHIKPTLLRLFVPILCGQTYQRKLKQGVVSGLDVQVGTSDQQQKTLNEHVASEFLFGHRTDYCDPISLAKRAEWDDKIVPPTRIKKPLPPQRPRYMKQVVNNARPTKVGAQRSLGGSIKRGARCNVCKLFFVDQKPGFVCAECANTDVAGATTSAKLRKYLLDIEDLRVERAELADTCHDCMGCRDAPKEIICQNSDCPVLWDRKQNKSSIVELEKRIETCYEMAQVTKAVRKLELC